MNKMYVAVAASLLAGFAVAAFTLRGTDTPVSPQSGSDAATYFDQSAAIEDRIQALEAAVADERNARQLLEEELLALYDAVDALGEVDPEPAESTPAAGAVAATRAEFFRRRGRGTESGEERTDALVAAGFSADRAAWIIKREDELRLEAMQARFEAQRAGDMQAMFTANNRSQSAMRDVLGELEYEQYLAAYGRPTTVGIGAVIESSPGQLAGLQAGDEIVRYDGQRVFSYAEINDLQLQGEPGASIVVDIMRDGTPMQIVMPRGPIGIQAGRFRGR